ncbi:hypothetical protein BSFA1_76300 (plasmid) [Burkholderia sp. SFA1]|nr:hypothetical protein BSFA1_76300 [Burkholderia sp. SFA1]
MVKPLTYHGPRPTATARSFGTDKYEGIGGRFDWQQLKAQYSDEKNYNYIGKKTGSYRIP